MDKYRDMLLQSLTEIIIDYRQDEDEVVPITSGHVEKWLNQFDPSDQPFILAEMNTIMKKFYFSKARIKENFREFLKNKLIGHGHPSEVLPHISFLRIQQSGSSQGAMLDLISDILQEDYHFSISRTGIKDIRTYIYVDDAIYTGNKLRYDLTDGASTTGWLSRCPSSNCTLLIYTIAFHKEAINYVSNHLANPAERKRIVLKIFTDLPIENSHSPSSNIEVLWPELIIGDSIIDSYTSGLCASSGRKIESDQLFRSGIYTGQEKLFSSPQSKQIVEKAFLKKGIQLVNASQSPAPSIRPLGFMKLTSLGFGTFFVTYRNIANNCPLVLWWGDPNFPSTHPLGKWYPLFPRRTNTQRVIM